MDWAPVSQRIWDMKYRFREPSGRMDADLNGTWQRVAEALAAAEKDPALWTPRFREALEGFKFLPAGRVIAGAGTGRTVTLFNCFVMGTIGDDMASIFDNVKEAALTMQQGGGIGHDFSTLRPNGAPVRGVGADASGPLSFMDVWDSMCRTIMSAGSRRGAMMATLRCDHPDIEAFVDAKRDPKRLRMFNMSVLVTDAFMQAVKDDADWNLVFGGKTFRTLKARDLWERIMRATYEYAEPGVIFIDRVNRRNNLHYVENIQATNPCGEQPLPPYGACLLGSINLAALVKEPFVYVLVTAGPLGRTGDARARNFLQQVASFFKNVDKAFTSFTKDVKLKLPPPTHPLPVLIFESQTDFDKYARTVMGGNGLPVGRVMGFYSELNNMLAIRLSECRTFETPLHEAIHQLSFNHQMLPRLAGTPRWFAEGLATADSLDAVLWAVAHEALGTK